MAASKIIKPNNEAPDDLEKEVAGVRILVDSIEIKYCVNIKIISIMIYE
jgi:hypothetical protein